MIMIPNISGGKPLLTHDGNPVESGAWFKAFRYFSKNAYPGYVRSSKERNEKILEHSLVYVKCYGNVGELNLKRSYKL